MNKLNYKEIKKRIDDIEDKYYKGWKQSCVDRDWETIIT